MTRSVMVVVITMLLTFFVINLCNGATIEQYQQEIENDILPEVGGEACNADYAKTAADAARTAANAAEMVDQFVMDAAASYYQLGKDAWDYAKTEHARGDGHVRTAEGELAKEFTNYTIVENQYDWAQKAYHRATGSYKIATKWWDWDNESNAAFCYWDCIIATEESGGGPGQ